MLHGHPPRACDRITCSFLSTFYATYTLVKTASTMDVVFPIVAEHSQDLWDDSAPEAQNTAICVNSDAIRRELQRFAHTEADRRETLYHNEVMRRNCIKWS